LKGKPPTSSIPDEFENVRFGAALNGLLQKG